MTFTILLDVCVGVMGARTIVSMWVMSVHMQVGGVVPMNTINATLMNTVNIAPTHKQTHKLIVAHHVNDVL